MKILDTNPGLQDFVCQEYTCMKCPWGHTWTLRLSFSTHYIPQGHQGIPLRILRVRLCPIGYYLYEGI